MVSQGVDVWGATLPTTQFTITTADGYPEVSTVSQKDFALGIPPDATFKVGPIPPKNSNGGGYTPQELSGSPNKHSETHYVLSTPGYEEIRCKKAYLSTDDPLAYYLFLRRV